MRVRALALLAAAGVAAVAVLSGCTTAPAPDGTVTVAVSEPLTSLNPDTAFGDTRTNSIVAHLTGSGFGYYDESDRLVRDESFGKAEIVSENPFRVRYTIADSARWSDGTRIDANDLLLAWAGNSGALNTKGFDPSGHIDPATGAYTGDFPKGVVYFDGAPGPGLQSSSGVPTTVPGGRAIEVTYASSFPDWAVAVEPGLPAHVLGRTALNASAKNAAGAVGSAILQKDTAELAPLSRAWNEAGNIAKTPDDHAILTASGPYRVKSFDTQTVTLVANSGYQGDRRAHVAKIVLKVIADPLQAVGALQDGTVDIATPQASEDVMQKLLDVKGIRVTQGTQGVFEHLDLQFQDSKTGAFADQRVREAFLKTVPRSTILKDTVGKVDSEAQVLQSFTLLPGGDGYTKTIATNGSALYDRVDIDGAVDLLDEAGVSAPEVCVLYDPGNPRRVTEFHDIQTSAAKAGIRVTDCSTPDWQARLGEKGAYDAALFSWDTTHLGPTAIAGVYGSTAPLSNFSGYASDKVDGLLTKLGSTADGSAQDAVLAKIDKQLWSDAYGLPLYQYVAVAGIGSRVKGVSLSPQSDGVFWNAWTWQLAGAKG